MEDLANERESVVERLTSFNFECVNAEGILPNGQASWPRIAEELDSCHLFVLILGDRYGWIPTSGALSKQGLSVTHGEYRRARELEIPVLAFTKRLRYSAASDTDDARLRDQFRMEVEEWEKGQFRTEFDRALDLAKKVAAAVTALLSDHYQRTAVQKRMNSAPAITATPPVSVQVPAALVNSVRKRETLLWAGSGISLSSGLPSMPVFAEQFVRLIRERVPGYEPPVVGTGFASIAADYQSMFSRIELAEQVRLLVELPRSSKQTPAHSMSIGLFPKIVTTNYDTLFELAIQEQGSAHEVIVNPSRFQSFSGTFLLKLHGSYTEPASLVITESDLADFEATRESMLQNLSQQLTFRSVLVVGSSLRDPSVLRIFRSRAASSSQTFCLLPATDSIAIGRLRELGIEPIVGPIENFFSTLFESVHA